MICIDNIGKIYDTDTTDPDNPIITEVDGWHVNSSCDIPEINQFKVEPTVPHRIFAGVETFYYRFEDEDEAYTHLGDRLKVTSSEEE